MRITWHSIVLMSRVKLFVLLIFSLLLTNRLFLRSVVDPSLSSPLHEGFQKNTWPSVCPQQQNQRLPRPPLTHVAPDSWLLRSQASPKYLSFWCLPLPARLHWSRPLPRLQGRSKDNQTALTKKPSRARTGSPTKRSWKRHAPSGRARGEFRPLRSASVMQRLTHQTELAATSVRAWRTSASLTLCASHVLHTEVSAVSRCPLGFRQQQCLPLEPGRHGQNACQRFQEKTVRLKSRRRIPYLVHGKRTCQQLSQGRVIQCALLFA